MRYSENFSMLLTSYAAKAIIFFFCLFKTEFNVGLTLTRYAFPYWEDF